MCVLGDMLAPRSQRRFVTSQERWQQPIMIRELVFELEGDFVLLHRWHVHASSANACLGSDLAMISKAADYTNVGASIHLLQERLWDCISFDCRISCTVHLPLCRHHLHLVTFTKVTRSCSHL